MTKKIILTIIGLVILLGSGIFVLARQQPSVEDYENRLREVKPIQSSEESQYLVFFIPVEGIYEAPTKQAAFNVIDKGAADIIERIGAVGNSPSRKLSFAILIPPWIVDRAYPGRMETVIEQAFSVAQKRNMPVYFSIMTHYMWNTRSDLWNFFDAKSSGYNPDNINNVEWTDWSKTPFLAKDGKSYRYIDWGAPERLAPHMCYNSPAIQKEITRLTRDIGGAIREGVDALVPEQY